MTQDYIGRSDQCVQCGELADFTATGRQECVKCAALWESLQEGDDTPAGEIDGEATWAEYSAGITLEEALWVADRTLCINGRWNLPASPERVAACLIALGDGIWDADTLEKFARRGAYHHMSRALEEMFPDAPGGRTDPWSAETYSDLYKDDYGCRPRGHVTGREMRAWLKARLAA